MANLVDTSVNGDLRVTGTMFGTQAGNYATCATAAGTAAKAVSISGFTLTTGIHVFVKFTVTNTAAVASLTLNVSGTGAKSMKYRGGNLPAVGTLSASRVYEFIYDGTNWELVGDLDTNTQTVTGVKGNAESSYRTGNVNITAANVGASNTSLSNITDTAFRAMLPNAWGRGQFSNIATGYALLATISTTSMDDNSDVHAVFHIQYLQDSSDNFLGEQKLCLDCRHHTGTTYIYRAHILNYYTNSANIAIKVYRTDNSDMRVYGVITSGSGKYQGAICHLISCTGWGGGSSLDRVTLTKGNATSNAPTGTEITVTAVTPFAASSHTHGNIANGGTLTDTAAAAAGNDYVVIRDADNAKIQTSTIKGTDVADAVSKKHSHSTLTLSTTAQAYDGSHTLALPSTDPYTSARTPTSHASSATTYGVGTAANYGHVKLDNSTPLGVTVSNADGVATGKGHKHNNIESVARASVTTVDLDHVNTNNKAHMILSQVSSSTSTTHDPGDGYILTFMWDTNDPYDAQLYIPVDSTRDWGRIKIRYRDNNSSGWGDWEYIRLAATSSLLTSSNNLDNVKGSASGQILSYVWSSISAPTNVPVSSAASMMLVYQPHASYCYQAVITAQDGIYRRICKNGTWTAWTKDLDAADITTGSTNGTISVAGTDVAVKGLGGAAYLNTGTASGTVATGNHTHTTSIASDSSSGTVVTLAHNTQYKLTAGGTSVLFKTPADNNTDTKVTQTADNSSTGTGFEVLFSATADNTTRTEASRKSSKLTFQPSTGTLTATKFSGPLTGNVTGNCSGSSGSCTGNAATATSATNVALTGSVKTTSTTNGDTIQFQAGSGTAGTVTIVNAKHAASADSATSASSASKVANKLTLKIKTGTTEGTNLYTYDGSAAKTLDIKQGSNITLTAGAGTLTIAGTADTKNTAGSTNTSSKIFLIGATSQAANPQTYSQDTTYVDTDATLASTKVRVAEKCTLQFNTTTNALDFVFA